MCENYKLNMFAFAYILNFGKNLKCILHGVYFKLDIYGNDIIL